MLEFLPLDIYSMKIAGFLDTTVGYLLGETEDAELLNCVWVTVLVKVSN